MNLKTNGIQHIGLPTDRFDETCAFYKGLGFVCRHENAVPGGGRVAFYELDGSFMMEIYEEQKDEYCDYIDDFSDDGGLSVTVVPGVQPEYAYNNAGLGNG